MKRPPRLRAIIAAAAFALAIAPSGASAAVHKLTVDVEGEGAVGCRVNAPEEEFGECAHEASYAAGTKLTLSVNPNQPGFEEEFGPEEHWKFSHWSGACSGSSLTCSPVEMNEDKTVKATFVPEPIELTIEKTGPGHGTIECDGGGGFEACKAEYPYETELTVLAVPDGESEFAGWEGCEFESEFADGYECELMIEEPTTVEAAFDLQPKLKIELLGSGKGEGSVECEAFEDTGRGSCRQRYPEEEEVIIYAKAGPGAEFAGWEGCKFKFEDECEVTMEGETAVRATFIAERTLTIEAAGSGTITSSPGSIHCPPACSGRFELGAKVTLTATPAAGSLFAGWAGGGCKGIGGCTVTVSGDMTVAGGFEPKPPPPPEVEEEPLEAGTAKAAASAQVKAGKAALKLSCSGGPCDGTLQLAAKVKQGHKLKSLVAGRAPFHLAAGAKKTIEVKLSGPVKQELAKGKTVKVKLSGTGVASATVTLEPAKTHKSH